MKYLLILLIAFIIVVAISCKNKAREISLPVNAYLIDVRTAAEFKRGSVPGAINIPLDQIENTTEALSDKENIVVFCRSGHRSGKAKKILATHGIHKVINGGSWKDVSAAIQP